MKGFVPYPGYDEYEDEASSVLDGWLHEAPKLIEWADRIKGRADAPPEARESAIVIGAEAKQQAELIPELYCAVHAGDAWRAIYYALRIGMAAGVIDSDPYLYHARRRLREVEPYVETGRKVREGGRTGALRRPPNTKKGPPDEILVREVKELHERNPRLSWSTVCERVGRRHGLSRRTVETRARAADWRQRSN